MEEGEYWGDTIDEQEDDNEIVAQNNNVIAVEIHQHDSSVRSQSDDNNQDDNETATHIVEHHSRVGPQSDDNHDDNAMTSHVNESIENIRSEQCERNTTMHVTEIENIQLDSDNSPINLDLSLSPQISSPIHAHTDFIAQQVAEQWRFRGLLKQNEESAGPSTALAMRTSTPKSHNQKRPNTRNTEDSVTKQMRPETKKSLKSSEKKKTPKNPSQELEETNQHGQPRVIVILTERTLQLLHYMNIVNY